MIHRLSNYELRQIPRYLELCINTMAKPTDELAATAAINFLWAKLGYDKPAIIFTDSPIAAHMRSKAERPRGLDITEELHQELYDMSQYIMNDVMSSQTELEADRQISEDFGGQLERVISNITTELNSWFNETAAVDGTRSWYPSLWWRGWVTYLAYTQRVGVKYDEEIIAPYRTFASNVPFIVPYKDVCFVSRNIAKISRDEQGRLHNDKEPAILFRDGSGVHAVRGIRFSQSDFLNIISDTPDVQRIVRLGNQEQRMAALSLLGADYLPQALDAEVVRREKTQVLTYSSANKLVRKEIRTDLYYTEFFSEPYWLAVYECPSTGRLYYKFDDKRRTSAVELIAAAFGQSEDEYLNTPKT